MVVVKIMIIVTIKISLFFYMDIKELLKDVLEVVSFLEKKYFFIFNIYLHDLNPYTN